MEQKNKEVSEKSKIRKDFLNELKHARSTGVLLETDPQNPYGPNYFELHNTIKIYYKFLRIRKYVQADPEEEDEFLKYNYKFYFGVIGAAMLGYLSAFYVANLVFRPFSRVLTHTNRWRGFYYGIFGGTSAALAHSYLYTQFAREYCIPFIEKYKKEAIKNGFDDYEISPDARGPWIEGVDWIIT